jgi:hypothetical protein
MKHAGRFGGYFLMTTTPDSEERRILEDLRGHEGYEPLQTARKSPRFEILWFMHGEAQSPLQRCGFALLSLLFAGAGLMLARDFIGGLLAADHRFWIPGMGAVICLIVGMHGLRNVLRFRRD